MVNVMTSRSNLSSWFKLNGYTEINGGLMQRLSLTILILAACSAAHAASEKVTMNLVTAHSVGQSIGSVTISETANGLQFKPELKTLSPGEHGFHLHTNGSCQPAIVDGKAMAGGAAGGHYDPHNTGKHAGPQGDGHVGDLPVLIVNADGSASASEPLVAPRLKTLDEVRGKALMIHVGGDNMADHPKPLGGGGERFACGVIK